MLFNRLTTKIFLSLVLGLVVFVSALVAFAQPTPTINYQGKLTDTNGLAVADGSYNMRFYLYNAVGVATTSAIWTEVLTGTDKVQVTNGLFSVMLGSTTPLTSVDFNQALYLGVEIGGSGSPAWDGEMSPRKPLGTVPAAFEAYELGGVASSSFLRSDQADTASGLLTFSGGLVSTASSTITNLTTSVATTTTLVINGESFTDLTGTGLTNTSGVLTVATATLGLGNGTYLGLTDTPSSFTANRIPYTNSGATALTDSANFTFDGTNLGFGNANGIAWNSTRYLYASTTNDSISYGEGAGTYFGATALYNTALGYQALYGSSTSIMTGDYNFAVGYRALYRNTTGSSNNALGPLALASNTTGTDNNAFGWFTLQNNTTGSYNNAFGWFTLQKNTTGSYNNAIGYLALSSNTIGTGNNALGWYALFGNTTGSYNNTLGYSALSANTTGSYNDVLGYYALSSNNGTGTIAIGYQVADNAVSVDRSIFIGYDIDAASTTRDNVLNIGNLIFGTGVDGTGTTLSSGNIGIGTSTPGSKLTVVGTAGTNPFTIASSTGVPLITVSQNGYLGIGTTNPQDALVISKNGTADGNGAVLVINEEGAGQFASGWLVFSRDSVAANRKMGLIDFNNAFIESWTDESDADGGSLRFNTDNLSGSSQENMRITALGNIGIGTTTPSSKLTVVGSFQLTGAFKDSTNATGTAGYVLQTTGTSTIWVATSTLGLGGSGASTFLALTDTPSSFTANRIPFTNSGATALTDSANFTFDGNNLALGTASTNLGLALNGVRVFTASSTIDSILIGEGAGDALTSEYTNGNIGNIFIGYQAGQNTTAPYDWANSGNVFMGHMAGKNADGTGVQNVVLGQETGYAQSGSYNSLIGFQAGFDNSGDNNNFIGDRAGYTNSGDGNNYFGYDAGTLIDAGNENVAIGTAALRGGTGDPWSTSSNATRNIAIGYQAGYSANGGDNNILIGHDTANNITSGANNIIIGYDVDLQSATQSNTLNIGNLIFGNNINGTSTTLSTGNIGIGTSTPGSKLTVAGEINIGDNTSFLAGIDLNGVPLATGSSTLNNWYFAGASSTTFTASSTYNYGIGEGALRYVTSGSSNIAIGKNALAATAANPLTGGSNIAIGPDAGLVMRGGYGNNLIGSNAGDSITTGYYNHMIGTESGNGITSGYHNTMIGFRTGMFITTGAHNTYIGSAAGENGGSATSYNTLVGNSAGANATGNYNTFMGYQAADNLTSGARNIMIGAQIDAASTTRSNQLNIGNLIFGTDVDGTGTTTSTGNIGIGTSTPGSKLTVAGTIQATDLLGGATNLTTDVNGNIIRDPSDVRLKENIQTLDDSLDKLLQLRGVSYEWIDKERFGEQTEIGFIAQEVDEVLPEVVRKGGDYWSLNTRNIVAVVVEAVKELYARLVTNESKVEELENRVNYLESLIEQQSAGGGSVSGGGNSTPPPPPAEPPVVEETPETPPVEEVMVEEEIIQEEVVVEETPETPPVEEVAPEELPAPAVEEVVVENSP